VGHHTCVVVLSFNDTVCVTSRSHPEYRPAWDELLCRWLGLKLHDTQGWNVLCSREAQQAPGHCMLASEGIASGGCETTNHRLGVCGQLGVHPGQCMQNGASH
jgi:hypothetical protein